MRIWYNLHMSEELKKETQSEAHATHTLADDIEQAKKSGKVKQVAPSTVESIHTLSSDLARALYQKKGTVVKLAIAEEEKRRMLEEGSAPYSKQNVFFIVASVALVIAGIGLLAFFFIKANPKGVEVQSEATLPTFVFTDGNITVPLQGKTADEARQAIGGAFTALELSETVVGIYPMNGAALLSLSLFVDGITAPIPTEVATHFIQTFMLGGYRTSDTVVPFLILKTVSEQDARNAMMIWEPTLYETFAKITSTAIDQSLIAEPFGNAIIRNKDARVLRDANGEIVLLYTFIDKQTLLIATKPDTVAMAIERLNIEKIVQ